MKRRKNLLIILSILRPRNIILIMVVMALIRTPFLLLRTNEGIRDHLLRVTPIGTSMEDVVNVINNNTKWEIGFIQENVGVNLHPTVIPTSATRGLYYDPNSPNVIGEKSIRVYLGTIKFIIWLNVEAFYAFDENGELIEIFVWRSLAL